jgi:site-specific recombinase XerD
MALRRETVDERENLPSPATVNAAKAALRMVLKTAWRLGLMTSEDCHRACDLEAVRGGRLPRGRSLTAGQVRALFSTCEHASPAGARDAALLALLYGCSLRRAEVVVLDFADWNREAFQIRVRGKGDKERIAHTDAVTHVLEAWL